MFRKIVTSLTLVAFVMYALGCYTKRGIYPTEVVELSPAEYKISKVVTIDGEVIDFMTSRRPSGGRYFHYVENWKEPALKDDRIEGFMKDGTFKTIPLSQVKMVYVQKFSPGKTVLAVIGISILLIGVYIVIYLLTKESCPFVYSFDGEKYVFDGEPYGRAICQGLQRTDLCHLEHLRPVDGEYRLLLTNEVDETQYTDEFKLWAIDHLPGIEVVPDADGNLHTIAYRQEPFLALDGRGEDISIWVSKKDLLLWESDVLSKDPDNPSDLRDTLLLAFQKPVDARKAKLIVTGCNTLWGSQMLKRDLELRGDQVQQWYESLKNPTMREMMHAWDLREEVFTLKVKVWADGGWSQRGVIVGGGPFVAEERVIPLDLLGINSDTVKILLAPPAGFWQLNSFTMDYSQDVDFQVQEISAIQLVGHDGTDLRAVLESTDSSYYTMPEIGQIANLTFPVPPLEPGLNRTLFAKVSGYYDIHLDASGPPQTDIRNLIVFEPGYFVKFSLQEYFKWRTEMLSETTK